MTCRVEVDRMHMKCTHAADRASDDCNQSRKDGQRICREWKDQGTNECAQWADEGYDECEQWADEGYDECEQWADEGHDACAEKYYKKCKWYSPWNCVAGWLCSAYYWVSNWVCKAYYWVSNWVCKAYYWVANWVCKAWHWVANLVCQGWYWVVNAICAVAAWVLKVLCLFVSWGLKLVCVGYDAIRCAVRGIFGRKRRARHPIEHVFVLMLENRSFDHMLGSSPIAGGNTTLDPKRGGMTGGETETLRAGVAWTNGQWPTPDGLQPSNIHAGITYHPQAGAPFKINAPDIDPPHEFQGAVVNLCGAGKAFNRGEPYPTVDMSGFVAAYADGVGSGQPDLYGNIMLTFEPEKLPILNRLASEFVLCDRWFSSMPGPTWPNRFFMHAASSGGLDNSPDGGSIVGNFAFDGYYFENGTIFDRLDAHCMEWRVFAGDAMPVTLALSGMRLNELQGRIHDFDEFAEAVADDDYKAAYTFIEPNYGNVLPVISEEDYTCGNSQHPVDDVTRGEKLIKEVYEAIRNSPLWEKSLLLVTYDEHGGFYDHVAPPSITPPGDAIGDEDWWKNGFEFNIAGVRVPALVISPHVPKGGIDHTDYDHSSLLATLERIFGFKPLTRRDASAHSLMHLFGADKPRQDAPADIGKPAVSGYRCDDGRMTGPGTGTRGQGLSHTGDAPVSPTIRAFAELAAMKAIAASRGRDRGRIVKELTAIQTDEGAKHFLSKAAEVSRGVRKSYRSSYGRFSHLFARLPDRPWRADPTYRYQVRQAPPAANDAR